MRVRALIIAAFLLTLPALGKKIKTIRVAQLVSDQPFYQQYADMMTAKLIAHLTEAGVSVVEGESETHIDA
jgi:hypothetical protein